MDLGDSDADSVMEDNWISVAWPIPNSSSATVGPRQVLVTFSKSILLVLQNVQFTLQFLPSSNNYVPLVLQNVVFSLTVFSITSRSFAEMSILKMSLVPHAQFACVTMKIWSPSTTAHTWFALLALKNPTAAHSATLQEDVTTENLPTSATYSSFAKRTSLRTLACLPK